MDADENKLEKRKVEKNKKPCCHCCQKKHVSKRMVNFDGQNLQETYHPKNKDYGLIKINEAKTPFVFANNPKNLPVDPEELNNELLNLKKTT